jgi:hypothetical protein
MPGAYASREIPRHPFGKLARIPRTPSRIKLQCPRHKLNRTLRNTAPGEAESANYEWRGRCDAFPVKGNSESK